MKAELGRRSNFYELVRLGWRAGSSASYLVALAMAYVSYVFPKSLPNNLLNEIPSAQAIRQANQIKCGDLKRRNAKIYGHATPTPTPTLTMSCCAPQCPAIFYLV